MGPSSVTNLRIWHEGMSIAKDSYSLSSAWPKSEMFGLTSQVRRAAVSIPCNLAEGRGRGSRAEMARFAHIALGSVYELDTLLLIAAELDLAGANDVTALRDRLSSLSRQISKYIEDRKPST
jgi:four helix bundle protein